MKRQKGRNTRNPQETIAAPAPANQIIAVQFAEIFCEESWAALITHSEFQYSVSGHVLGPIIFGIIAGV